MTADKFPMRVDAQSEGTQKILAGGVTLPNTPNGLQKDCPTSYGYKAAMKFLKLGLTLDPERVYGDGIRDATNLSSRALKDSSQF